MELCNDKNILYRDFIISVLINRNDININIENNNTNNALMLFLKSCDINKGIQLIEKKIIEKMINKTDNINVINEEKETALILASKIKASKIEASKIEPVENTIDVINKIFEKEPCILNNNNKFININITDQIIINTINRYKTIYSEKTYSAIEEKKWDIVEKYVFLGIDNINEKRIIEKIIEKILNDYETYDNKDKIDELFDIFKKILNKIFEYLPEKKENISSDIEIIIEKFKNINEDNQNIKLIRFLLFIFLNFYINYIKSEYIIEIENDNLLNNILNLISFKIKFNFKFNYNFKINEIKFKNSYEMKKTEKNVNIKCEYFYNDEKYSTTSSINKNHIDISDCKIIKKGDLLKSLLEKTNINNEEVKNIYNIENIYDYNKTQNNVIASNIINNDIKENYSNILKENLIKQEIINFFLSESKHAYIYDYETFKKYLKIFTETSTQTYIGFKITYNNNCVTYYITKIKDTSNNETYKLEHNENNNKILEKNETIENIKRYINDNVIKTKSDIEYEKKIIDNIFLKNKDMLSKLIEYYEKSNIKVEYGWYIITELYKIINNNYLKINDLDEEKQKIYNYFCDKIKYVFHYEKYFIRTNENVDEIYDDNNYIYFSQIFNPENKINKNYDKYEYFNKALNIFKETKTQTYFGFNIYNNHNNNIRYLSKSSDTFFITKDTSDNKIYLKHIQNNKIDNNTVRNTIKEKSIIDINNIKNYVEEYIIKTYKNIENEKYIILNILMNKDEMNTDNMLNKLLAFYYISSDKNEFDLYMKITLLGNNYYNINKLKEDYKKIIYNFNEKIKYTHTFKFNTFNNLLKTFMETEIQTYIGFEIEYLDFENISSTYFFYITKDTSNNKIYNINICHIDNNNNKTENTIIENINEDDIKNNIIKYLIIENFDFSFNEENYEYYEYLKDYFLKKINNDYLNIGNLSNDEKKIFNDTSRIMEIYHVYNITLLNMFAEEETQTNIYFDTKLNTYLITKNNDKYKDNNKYYYKYDLYDYYMEESFLYNNINNIDNYIHEMENYITDRITEEQKEKSRKKII